MPHLAQIPKKASPKPVGQVRPTKPPPKEPDYEHVAEHAGQQAYRGKKTKTGNSQALRFDIALFKSHPEFSGDVEAYVIAPGRLLVVSLEMPPLRTKADPVIASFLSFLAQDMERNPHHIEPLDANLMARVEKLTDGMKNRFDEPLPDEELL